MSNDVLVIKRYVRLMFAIAVWFFVRDMTAEIGKLMRLYATMQAESVKP